MSEYSFCESEHATSTSKWHIRKLTSVGKKLGGGTDTPSLCTKIKRGWDISVSIERFEPDVLKKIVCRECLGKYQELIHG